MDSRILQLSHVIHLAIKYKMYLKFSKNFAAFVAFQNRPCPAPLTPRKKQGWILRRTISWRKAFPPPQKENWEFSSTFSFHLCLLTVYFQPQRRNFGLENQLIIIARQPFRWHTNASLMCQNSRQNTFFYCLSKTTKYMRRGKILIGQSEQNKSLGKVIGKEERN